MALIGTLIDFEPGVTARSADVDQNFNDIRTAFNNTAVLTDVARVIDMAVTPTSGAARAWTLSPTLTASANDNELTALRIAPSFVPGAFTGTLQRAIDVVSGESRFGGAVTLLAGLTGTTATFSGDVVAGTIRRGTSDGADNSSIALAGGGAASSARGAHVTAWGNEHATLPGLLWLVAGNVAGGKIQFNTEATDRGEMTGGRFLWGTTSTAGVAPGGAIFNGDSRFVSRVLVGGSLTTNAGASDVILNNTSTLRSVTAAGTDTMRLIEANANDYVRLAGSGHIVVVGSIGGAGANGGDVCIGYNKAIRSNNSTASTNLWMMGMGALSGLHYVALGDASAAVGIGSMSNMSGVSGGELVLGNAKALMANNSPGTSNHPLIHLDSDSVVCLGGANASVNTGTLVRMKHHNALTPLGNDPSYNGIMYLTYDGTNYYFNAHMNGGRFRVAMTAF